MSYSDVLATISAADPLRAETAERLNLRAAEDEMLERISATARQRRSVSLRRPGRASHSARALALVAAVTAIVVVALALVPSGRHRDSGPAPAFAAELVRFANSSPLVVLDAPGWHVVYANEESRTYGELDYIRGPATASGTPKGMVSSRPSTFAGRSSQLAWRSGPLSRWVHDRAASSSLRTTAHVLGTTAQVFQVAGTHGYLAISAVWAYNGRVMEFGAPVSSMAQFKAELDALRSVDPDTWLRALPRKCCQDRCSHCHDPADACRHSATTWIPRFADPRKRADQGSLPGRRRRDRHRCLHLVCRLVTCADQRRSTRGRQGRRRDGLGAAMADPA